MARDKGDASVLFHQQNQVAVGSLCGKSTT
jgi:hypothetical protein